MKPWEKVGPPQLIAKKFGIALTLQKFFRPEAQNKKDENIDWALVGGDGKTVVIFPITKNLEVVAIKEFKCGANKIMPQLPCGNSEKNENPVETADRELTEETGYISENIDYLSNREYIWFEPTHVEGKYTAVLAKNCKYIQEPKLDETENIELILIPIKKWLKMIDSGEITDSKSIAVTYLALKHLGFLELKI